MRAPDRETGGRAEGEAGEDDDVGGRLDVGEGGKGDPAGDRQGGEGGDQGDDLRGRPRALIPGEARDQDDAEDQEAGQLPAHQLICLRKNSRALLGRHDAGQVEDAGDLGGEVPATGENLGGLAIGDHDPVAEQHHPLGEGGGELDVVGGDDDAGAAGRRSLSISSTRSSLRARSMPRVGSSSATRPGSSSLLHPAGEGDRQRQSLPLAAGEVARVGVDRVLQAHRAQRRQARIARQLVADPLADQVVAWVLSQQRDTARRLGLAPHRVDKIARASAATCSCPPRCAP